MIDNLLKTVLKFDLFFLPPNVTINSNSNICFLESKDTTNLIVKYECDAIHLTPNNHNVAYFSIVIKNEI